MKKILFLSAFALFVLVGCKCNAPKAEAEGECTETVACEATCDMEKPCCKAGEECKCLENNQPCECNCAEGKCCCENCDPANCQKAGKKECKKECMKDGEGCQKECKKACTKDEGACEKTCEKKCEK